MQGSDGSATLSLDPTQDYTGDGFLIAPDGVGGISINPVSDTQLIAFTRTDEALLLLNPGNLNGVISGLAVGDSIDISGIGIPTSVTLGEANNILTLQVSEGNATLSFDLTQDHSVDGFLVAPDGAGGTSIIPLSDTQPIGFTSTNETLLIVNPNKPTGTISGFVQGDTIDLPNTLAASAVLGPNNSLVVNEGSETGLVLNLDPSRDYTGIGFKVVSDGSGGSLVIPIPASTTNFYVSTATELSADIKAIDLASQSSNDNGVNYTINIAPGATLSESSDIEAVNLNLVDTLTIKGQGAVLDGQNAHRGLFIYQGNVTIQDLTIQNAVAKGGNGAGGGGGGAGLGGGLFIGNPAVGGTAEYPTVTRVTLSNVNFFNDSAIGGDGGSGSDGGGGGLGGNGGAAADGLGGGGGGGVGGGADGNTGGSGIIPGAKAGNGGSGDAFGDDPGGQGGADAGGGGLGGNNGLGGGGGGGGGLGGQDGFDGHPDHNYSLGGLGGDAGFGGGGGGFGGGFLPYDAGYMAGGFGGGGGGGSPSANTEGGRGGFGGGAGSVTNSSPGDGGGNSAEYGGGGGLGAGADIFVAAGASLAIEGGSLKEGQVAGGQGASGAQDGQAWGSGIFWEGGDDYSQSVGSPPGFITLSEPNKNQTAIYNDVLYNQIQTIYGYNGYINIGNDTHINIGTVVLSANNEYITKINLNSGILELVNIDSGGTGAINFHGYEGDSFSIPVVLQVDSLTTNGDVFPNTIDGVISGDKIDVRSLNYASNAKAAVSGSMLTVTSNGISENFNLGTEITTKLVVTDDGHNGTMINFVVDPTITGTQAGFGQPSQTTSFEIPLDPFYNVIISDQNQAATDTLTITLSGSGGTLVDGKGFDGLTQTGLDTYVLASDTPDNVTAELDALIFTPKGGATNTSSTTTFALIDQSSAGTSANDDSTTVVDLDSAVAPIISGTQNGQTTYSEAPINPFSTVSIIDLNTQATDTFTISMYGEGTLADGVGFHGLTNTAQGVYTLASDTPANVTAELDALVFTPTGGEGDTPTTIFYLTDHSNAGTSASTVMTVTVEAVAPQVFITNLSESSTQSSQSIYGMVTPASGTSVAGQTVTLTDNGNPFGTTQVDDEGNWTASVTLPYQGSNSIIASFTDSLGNTATSDPLIDNLISSGDTTKPTVSSVEVAGDGIIDGSGDLGIGKTVTVTINTSKTVFVDTTNGTPTISLNDGGTATYVGGSGTSALTFTYTVGAGQNTADLAATGASLNGATIVDAAGNGPDLHGALTNPPGILQIDTTKPTVSSVEVAGDGITDGSGDLGIGKTVTVTINTSKTVFVDTTNGTPTISLNDGGTATYVGGSGTSALTFTYTVGAGQNTADLAATGASLNGATIVDAAGNGPDLHGALTNPPGILQIDTTKPTVSSVEVAGDGITDGSGDLGIGKTVTVTINTSETVFVDTTNGTPTISLNDGGTATYVGGSGTSALTFTYTVGAGQNTADLAATGASLNGATIVDAAGNGPDLHGALTNPPGILQIDTTPPAVTESLTNDTGSSSTDKITADDALSGTGDPNAVVYFTVDGTALAGTTTADATGAWTLTPAGLADGSHTIVASETDAAGNTGTASLTFTLVTPVSPPTLTITGFSAGAVPIVSGTAEAGAAVTLYDGTTNLGTTTADPSTGAFKFSGLSALAAGEHDLTATATDTAGDVSAASSSLVVEVGTAATIVAELDALETKAGLAAIVLTDTQGLPVDSVATINHLVSSDASALALIQGSYYFEMTNATSGSTSTSYYNSAGLLTNTSTNNPDGSTTLDTFDPSGTLVRVGITYTDNSRDVEKYDITGQSYTTEHDTYNSAGVLTSQIRTHADGTPASSYVLNPDGSSVLENYDASGTPTRKGTTYADKSQDIYKYGITGQSFTTEHNTYNSVGVLTSQDRFHADGTDDSTYVLNPDGSSELDYYNASGILSRQGITHADKSQDVYKYSGGSPDALTEHDVINAQGTQTLVDQTQSDGSHKEFISGAGQTLTSNTGVSDIFNNASAGSTTFVFNPSFGQDAIYGFHAGIGSNHDTIHINNPALNQFADLVAMMSPSGAGGQDTLITVDPNDTILLKHVTISSLNAKDFTFNQTA